MSILSIFLLIFLGIIIFFVIIMVVDTHRLVTRDYAICSSGILNDIRIVLLSDLHSKSFGKDNKKLTDEITRLNPDLVLIAGDMYTALKKDTGINASKLLTNLAKKYPIYYADGNHEQKTSLLPGEFDIDYNAYFDKLNAAGVVHLNNEAAVLPQWGIKIYGLTLPFEYYRKMSSKYPEVSLIEELIGRPDKDMMNILIAHNPRYFDRYAEWGADLTVSGHVHGGLMRLGRLGGVISPNLKFFPKYSGGQYKADDSDSVMVLSCGLGTHHLPIRIFNPAEISCIDIKKKTT